MKRSLGARPIAYPTPVFLVGTYDAQGRPNIMTAAWAGICCSRPPCVSVSLRKATYSHGSITRAQAFTVSIPSAGQVMEADYAGIYSGKELQKFDELGLTPVRSELVDAPYVEQCSLVLECTLAQTHELGLHTQFVGEILDVKADEQVLDDRGRPEILKVDPLIYATGDQGYYAVGRRVATAFSVGKKDQ